MHELGIARNILTLVQEHVPEGRGGAVRVVRVRVGRLAGVIADSLAFGFEALVRETPFEHARLEIEAVPVRGHCGGCGADFDIEPPAFSCPACGRNDIRVTGGTELYVTEIELADLPEEARAEVP